MGLALAVVLWVSGFVLVGLGLLIRNGHPELIAGYDSEGEGDPEGLAAFAGRWTIVLGVGHVAAGFVPETYWSEGFGIAFTAIILLFSAGMILGTRRYT